MRRSLLLLSAVCLALAVLPLRAADDDPEALRDKAIQAAVAKAAPFIVQIETAGGADMIVSGGQGKPVIRKGHGPTSGVVVGADGFVITSSFNFVNKPTDIFVTVPGQQQRFVAKVAGRDTTRMLTLLKIEANNLPVPTATPKAEVKVGQTALALGRAYDAIDRMPNLSVGIVSAVNRLWGKAIQTDAKISPANYGGPLIDLQGRVMGVLIPASPRGEDEISGVEYYDSGLGFAIPLEDILAVLPKMKEKKELKKGLLGITPQNPDIYGPPVTIGQVQPGSAAEKAGIKVGDVVKEVDSKPVANQAQLMHLLGPKYDGDTVSIKLARGGEEIELKNIVLGGTAEASAQGWLGILPMRDDPELGVEVRYVYPKSPADTAGVKVGDRIMKLGGPQGPMQPFSGRDQFMTMLSRAQAGQDVRLEVTRKDGGKTETLTVKLGAIPDEVPDKLPKEATQKKALEPRKGVGGQPPPPPPKPADDKKPETGLVAKKNAAADRSFYVYVPKDYDPNISYALVLWLHPINKGKKDDISDFTDTWEDYCTDHHCIIVAPITEAEGGWTASDAEFVQEAVQSTLGAYTIDRRRIIAHGMGNGGQMAFYVGFQARDLFRAVATSGAGMTGQPKEKLPTQPLTFFLIAGSKDPLVKLIAETKTKLTDAKYPVIYREVKDMGHQYSDEKTLEELVRWIDSLDRI
jgi:serine protease Do